MGLTGTPNYEKNIVIITRYYVVFLYYHKRSI